MDDTPRTAAQLFSDIPEPRNTRERVLFGALELFYTHGFHAVGLDAVLAEVGVTKTTFYNHFQSREHLVREAVELRDNWDQAAFGKRARELGGYVPSEMLMAMFDVLDEWFNGEEFRGCIFIHACAEFPSMHHPVHRAAANHFLSSLTTVEKIATAAQVSDPASFAKQWLLLLQGAVTLRMILGDNDAAKVAKGTAQLVLNAALPKPA